VRALLEAGANPLVRSTTLDMTPYELASFCGLEAAADLLCEFRPAPPHPSGMTELWLKAASRLPEEIAGPIGQDHVNTIWRRATPLMMAAGHAAHFQIADRLLRAGADPNAGTSILHASCDWHFEHLVPAIDYLAGKGWNVNSADGNKQTALHKAAFLGYAAAIRALLGLKADPTVKDSDGMTPMDIARQWNKGVAVRALSR
jgi:ankyrin repeat protein